MNQHGMSPGERARARYRDDEKRGSRVYRRIEAARAAGKTYCPECGGTDRRAPRGCLAHALTEGRR